MKHATLPCCYFPTRVMIVDDMKAFSENLSFYVPAKTLMFNDPQKALAFLKTYQPHITENSWLQADNLSDLADGSLTQPFMINTARIKAIYAKPQRHEDISVLIIDYHMPELNGLDLLKKLENKPFKTILLTGEGDHTLAVNAFNEGLIDYFLRKDDAELTQKIQDIVKQLQQAYFSDMSKKSCEMLKEQLPLFADSEINAYFYEKMADNHIKEFYLTNMQGHYLLIDDYQQKHYFYAYTEAQLHKLSQHAAEDRGTLEIMSALQRGEKIPFFGEDTAPWEIEASAWGDYLYPANKIQTKRNKFFTGVL